MNLVKSRDKWKERFVNGEPPESKLLMDYRKYRDTEDWRATSAIEELLEYILYLERNQINEEA